MLFFTFVRLSVTKRNIRRIPLFAMHLKMTEYSVSYVFPRIGILLAISNPEGILLFRFTFRLLLPDHGYLGTIF